MSLLKFSLEPALVVPVEEVSEMVVSLPLFEIGAVYELDGCVFRAQLFGDTWLLADLNRSYRHNNIGVAHGYLVIDDKLYQCEYAWHGGRRWWQIPPSPVDVRPSDFRRCGVVVNRINLNE